MLAQNKRALRTHESTTVAMVAILLLIAICSKAPAQTRKFTADDLSKVVRITDPEISPDGKAIACVIGRANLTEDRWESEIELIDVESKQAVVVTHDRKGVSQPTWSPTGDRLAFLAQDADSQAQIFVVKRNSLDPIQVTHSKTGVRAMAWRPDGLAFAYAAADEEPTKRGEAKFDDAFEVGDNDFLKRSKLPPIHLWMVVLKPQDSETNDVRRLTSGIWSLSNGFAGEGPPFLSFTPNGNSIVFVRSESAWTGDSNTGRLMSVNVATGEMHTLAPSSVEEEQPIVSPDGSKVAYLSLRAGMRKNEVSLFVAPTDGSKGTDATFALDRSIAAAAWLPDSRSLLVAATDQTREEIWTQPIQGKATRLNVAGLNLRGRGKAISINKNGSTAFIAVTADKPAELFYVAHPGDVPVQMTHLQTVTDGLVVGKSTTVKWQCDQFNEYGVLTYPPDYVTGKKYPLVLYIHGGPRSSSVEGFFPQVEVLAGQGWLVFQPNYRGSDNIGNAYEAAITNDAGAGPGRDVMAGVRAVEKLGIVDETRIAVTGWSYGGYMTSWLIGKYPSVWKAAIAGAPVTDWMDQYTSSDITWFAPDIAGPSPYVGSNARLYRSESPITYVGRAKTPTLILADAGDFRVPIIQSYKLYHALKDNGVPVKFFVYPVNGHTPADPIRYRDVYRRWTAWLAEHFNDSGTK